MLNLIQRINKKVVAITTITIVSILLLILPLLHQTIGTHTAYFSVLSAIQSDIDEQQFNTPYFIYHSIVGYKNTNNPDNSQQINNNNTTITANCDIVTNYDNTIVIEYKGNQYKCTVHDGNNYNKSTQALVSFHTNNIGNLKQYKITDIKPL